MLWMVLTIFLLVPAVFAADSPKEDVPILQSEVSKGFITIGEKISYTISARHAPAVQILDIDASDTLRFFEVKEWHNFSDKKGIDVVEGKKFVITTFEIGQFVLAPAKVIYLDRVGVKHEVLSNSLYVTVESVDKNGKAKEDILGMKGVMSFKSVFRSFAFWVVFFVVLLSALIVWVVLRRKKGLLGEAGKPSLSPHDEAYRALSQLFDSDMIRSGQYSAYFAGMSEILRRYFERRYHMGALEATTEELIQKIRERDLDGKTKTLIREVLETCDLIKFAKYVPMPAEIISLNRQAKEIVDITKEVVRLEQALPS